MASINLQAAAYPGATCLYPAFNPSGVIVLALVDKSIALLAEQKVTNQILIMGGPPFPDINQMRADALSEIVPPGSL